MASTAWLLLVPIGAGAEPASRPEILIGHPDAAEMAARYVAGFSERERLAAGNALMARELDRLETALAIGASPDDLLDDLERIDPDTRLTLTEVWQANAGPVVESLNTAEAELEPQVRQIQADWLEVRTAVNGLRFLLFEVEGSRRIAGQLASLLSVDNRWFWLFGLVAVATLLGLVAHDRRHEWRRRVSGGRARRTGLSRLLAVVLALLAGITAATFVKGNRIYEALLTLGSEQGISPRAAIEAQQAALDVEIAALREKRRRSESRHQTVQDQYRRRLTDALPPGSSLAVRWKKYRERVLGLAEAVALLERLPQSTEADLEELASLDRQLGEEAEAAARYLRLKRWVRGGLGLVLTAISVVLGLLYWRGVRARRELTANTCPLCLGTHRLEPVPDFAHGGVPGNVGAVQCRNVVSEEPYEECDYTFMDVYRPMTKVCFPTLGVPQAGKTHWLA
ncbi:MAG: hypothetical protein ACYTG0_24875, partial [Planctomycetota bacterium]